MATKPPKKSAEFRVEVRFVERPMTPEREAARTRFWAGMVAVADAAGPDNAHPEAA